MKLSVKHIALTAVSAIFVTIASLGFQSGERLFTASDAKQYNGSPCVFKEYGFPLPIIYSTDEPCSYSTHNERVPSQIKFLDNQINLVSFFTNSLLTFIILLLPTRYIVRKRSRIAP